MVDFYPLAAGDFSLRTGKSTIFNRQLNMADNFPIKNCDFPIRKLFKSPEGRSKNHPCPELEFTPSLSASVPAVAQPPAPSWVDIYIFIVLCYSIKPEFMS